MVRTLLHAISGMARPRKRTILAVGITAGILALTVFTVYNPTFEDSDELDQRLIVIMAHLKMLDSLYLAQMLEIATLQNKNVRASLNLSASTNLSPEVTSLLRNTTGMRIGTGLNPRNLKPIKSSFIYQLLPHLAKGSNSLRPAYHLKGNRSFVDFVVGIPTVRRDKESYLLITIAHLIQGLSPEDYNKTAIIVFVGETDLEFVVSTVKQIESTFPGEVANGLIEVISPGSTFYPDFDSLPPTLGDSPKRFRWRTKQNLDTMYLMAYAQTIGSYYLMVEDDVIAKEMYMKEIKTFIASTTLKNPDWFMIEFCTIGGIGKLFRSSDLLHFITYVQLFYDRMPIDWLLESYIADRICTIHKHTDECSKSKATIRVKYGTNLFHHIGLYSSLKGKIQKINHTNQYVLSPTFFPHSNPPLSKIHSTIEQRKSHSIKEAYEGRSFFWGTQPKKDDIVEFWFEKPIILKKYTFRSGSVGFLSDRFYHALVEVLPKQNKTAFIEVGTFDEFGLAEGEIKPELNPLEAIRLRALQGSKYWIILSEIELLHVDQS